MPALGCESPRTLGDYLVGHTSGVFVITADDTVRLMYPFGTRQEDWVNDLPRIAIEPDWQPWGRDEWVRELVV